MGLPFGDPFFYSKKLLTNSLKSGNIIGLLKIFFLIILVFLMKLMMQVSPGLARKIIAQVGLNEVIACGLMLPEENKILDEAMIYYLGIEDTERKGILGIYTVDKKFTYPDKREVYLFLSSKEPELERGRKYQAKLIVADY